MATTNSQNAEAPINRYVQLISPLFQIENVDLVEFVACLLRVNYSTEEGWDSLEESREMLQDLMHLNRLPLEDFKFSDSSKTHWRLHLLAYVHLTEMNAPYHMLANLLRVRCQMRYNVMPFRVDEGSQPHQSKSKKNFFHTPRSAKISELKMLAHKAGLADLAKIFDDFYFPGLRNSIAHSDYVIHENELRLVNNQIPDEKGRLTSQIPLDRLSEIIACAYDFYTAFFTIEILVRGNFSELKGKSFPYDTKLKGLVEFLIDPKGILHGFRIHWPNYTESFFRRTDEGSRLKNIRITQEGELEFLPGRIFKSHDDFSPLLPKGRKHKYTKGAGSNNFPAWPK